MRARVGIDRAVADDGCGIAPGRARDAALAGHIGLASCRERAAAAGGSLTLEGGPSRGTTVRVTVPEMPAGRLAG